MKMSDRYTEMKICLYEQGYSSKGFYDNICFDFEYFNVVLEILDKEFRDDTGKIGGEDD